MEQYPIYSKLNGDLHPWVPLLWKGALIYLVFWISGAVKLFKKSDTRVPPEVKAKIPIIGHALGLLKDGNLYLPRLIGAKSPAAFTIDLVFAKYCLITTSKLLAAVQRSAKTISFEPLLIPMTERMAGVRDKQVMALLCSKLDPDGPNLMTRVLHGMHPHLLGDGLNAMNRQMIQYLKLSFTRLSAQSESTDIYAWIQDAITIATTDAVYGPRNPYKDPEVQQGFWDWEADLIYLLADVFPKYTARKGYRGREKCVAAFREYFSIRPTIETSSAMTDFRWNIYMVKNKLDVDTFARLETALAFGLLDNSVPTTFWIMFEIYKRPDLLQELREEVIANALHIEKVDGSTKHIIDLADLRQSCPHLVSTFQETLRLRMKGSIVRMVTKDTIIEDQKDQQYLLKDGTLLQVTASHFNQSSGLWGEDGQEFNSRRFMQLQNTSKARQGFLAFGTAPNTCPGRHFAAGEIMCLVAMLILRFNIEPESGWVEPELNKTSVAAAVVPPKYGFRAKITPRKKFVDCEWDYRVSEGKNRFNLIIG